MSYLDRFKNKFVIFFQPYLTKIAPYFDFVKNSLFQRWAIAFILCTILALLMAPGLQFSEPKFQLGMIAPKNIKADYAFLVEDRQATEQKKMEDAENILPVYDYNSNLVDDIRTRLVKALSIAAERQDIHTREKTTQEKSDFIYLQNEKKFLESKLGIYLSPEEFYFLNENKFSDDIQQKLSNTIISFYENKYITSDVFDRSEKQKGIIIRNLKTQISEEIKDLSSLYNINDIDTPLSKTVDMVFREETPSVKETSLSIIKKLIEPNLTFNKEATERKKISVMGDSTPTFFQVQKNEMIVREGEKIGYFQLAKLNAYYKSAEENKFARFSTLLGFFLTAMFLSIVLYLWRTRNWSKTSERSNLDLLVFGIIALLQIMLIKIGIFIAMAINRSFPSIPVDACYYAIPFALGAMTTAILINRNVALIISALTSFLIGFIFDEKVIFPLFSFLGSIAASYQIVRIRQRSVFMKIGLFLGIINMVAIICLNLITGNLLNDLWIRLIMGFIGGILTGILVAGITPLFESAFGFITDIKLLELANLNQPLFQRMILEAPGTYHHSIIVSSLAEAAAEAIGANSLLVKVSAYYHDIGKLKKPLYFIENQQSSDNRHDKLSPKMSGLIIISHVKDGCELAAQAKLGRQIINIIRQHHGTSIVSYFYGKAKKDKDESIRSLSETDFRYPGPKPQTKEAGLIMLGDVIEASSRTLSNPTPARIKSLVRERIEGIYMDGQLDECELTLSNLNTIAETFTKILTGIFHHRVDYPDAAPKEGNGKKETDENTNRKQTIQIQN
ncbi:MAG TPA: HDIG domain-containing protein [Smithella sp.]|nr:HDIG domain-containing protein [Smithella sp.]MDM7987120.1 HDIG domain-containing protein [Smithella sp.]HNY50551.1 HDIG domain-containing protein [Smithella sp.]HOG90273.1 HDIG domain-containing protein [Smithella sp.]HOU51046.1 HDIG domain-containing protein [Smithella sp.]